jgi:four helix bundle protein
MAIKTIHDLEVHRLAYSLAMQIFKQTIRFPKEEIYSLIDQIRRSSRSVAINIREGYAKRKYENVFTRHLKDAFGSSEETRGWLLFARDRGYMKNNEYDRLDEQYDHVNAMLFKLMNNWKSIINP